MVRGIKISHVLGNCVRWLSNWMPVPKQNVKAEVRWTAKTRTRSKVLSRFFQCDTHANRRHWTLCRDWSPERQCKRTFHNCPCYTKQAFTAPDDELMEGTQVRLVKLRFQKWSLNVSSQGRWTRKLSAQSCVKYSVMLTAVGDSVHTWKVSSSKTTRRATSLWASQRDSNSPWFCSKCHSTRRPVGPRTEEVCYRRCLFGERTPMFRTLAPPWRTAPTNWASLGC